MTYEIYDPDTHCPACGNENEVWGTEEQDPGLGRVHWIECQNCGRAEFGQTYLEAWERFNDYDKECENE